MSTAVDVSVIIPVFNTEEYLAECLDSILAQSLQSIEVICVDDGSTDRSVQILEGYARRDPRIVVLADEGAGGSGPGAARNLGIDRARGDFIAFVDSDDYVHPDFLRILYGRAKEKDAEVVMCTISKFSASGTRERYATCTYHRHISDELDDEGFTWRDLEDPFLLRFAAWNKIYRKSFLDRHAIRFSEGIFFEDMIFTFRSLLLAERLWLVRDGLYYNRRQRQGATTFEQSNRVFGALTAVRQLEEFLSSDDEYRELDQRFAAFRFAKLTEYLHKNDAEHMPRFYAALEEVARDVGLEANPYLSEYELLKRDMILKNDLLGFLVWEIWDTKNRYAKARRQRLRVSQTNKQLKRRLNRSPVYRLEMFARERVRRLRSR